MSSSLCIFSIINFLLLTFINFKNKYDIVLLSNSSLFLDKTLFKNNFKFLLHSIYIPFHDSSASFLLMIYQIGMYVVVVVASGMEIQQHLRLYTNALRH